ncbi:MAG: ubiquitin-like small modifier protein 1 [Methanocella sp.]
MKVRFRLFANFREAAKQKDVEIAVGGNTINDAIRALLVCYPAMEPMLYQDGRLKQYVNVLLNGQIVKGDQTASVTVKEGDEIALFPPVSGG